MTQSQQLTLSKSVVEDLPVEGEDAIFWDRKLSGFGVRVYPSGKKLYVVQTRALRPLEAGFDRSARRPLPAQGARDWRRDHRPHQEGPAAVSGGADTRADRGRPRRALHARICRTPLQACDRLSLSWDTSQAHRACTRRTPRQGRHAQRCPGLSHRPVSRAPR